jgi:ribosome biogenesis GTPase / thiamine phosphate phosphatase
LPASRLVALGWDDRLAAHAAELPPHHLVGRVVRVDRGRCTVAVDVGDLRPSTPTPVGVGDWVAIDVGSDRVHAVLPRRSVLSRRAPGRETAELVLAANVDHVLVVHGINRPVNERRLERELVVAWDSGAVPAVVLTKADLCGDPVAVRDRVERAATGVEVVVASSRTGEGVDRLVELVAPGRTFVLVGASGVGKSSLVNLLAGTSVQATQDIREADGRGRHTTTAGQLVLLPHGAVLIDTPGLREVGLWDGDDGLHHVFADIDALAAGCRFRDCAHRLEPGCAVVGAVDAARLDSWRRLGREAARIRDDREGWEVAEERRQRRAFARSVRQLRPRP